MKTLRSKLHTLIDRLGDEELEPTWNLLETLYHDFYMLRAIEEARRSRQPGDTLTHEEAIQRLYPL